MFEFDDIDKNVVWLVEFYVFWLLFCVSLEFTFVDLSCKYIIVDFKFVKFDFMRWFKIGEEYGINVVGMSK